jgi:hypothetical protein
LKTVEQCAGDAQVERAEAFGEPVVDASQGGARRVAPTLRVESERAAERRAQRL